MCVSVCVHWSLCLCLCVDLFVCVCVCIRAQALCICEYISQAMRSWTGGVIDLENLKINWWTAGAGEIRSEAQAGRSEVRHGPRANSNLRIIGLGEMYLYSLISFPLSLQAVTVYSLTTFPRTPTLTPPHSPPYSPILLWCLTTRENK